MAVTRLWSMGSWSRSEPRSATTCGRGGPAGSRRFAGAGAVVTAGAGEPDPKAVRSSVTSAAIEAATSPAMRRALRLATVRALSVRPAGPGARGDGMRRTVTGCRTAVEDLLRDIEAGDCRRDS